MYIAIWHTQRRKSLFMYGVHEASGTTIGVNTLLQEIEGELYDFQYHRHAMNERRIVGCFASKCMVRGFVTFGLAR